MLKIKHLKTKLLVTAAVLIYAAILYISPISCVFYEIFGIPCMGCGMTRAWLSALKLDFSMAFSYHFMFWLLPILFICFLRDGRLFDKKEFNIIFYSLTIIGFLINWVHRIFVGF